LTCFAWIFFRAENIADAVYVIRHLAEGIASPFSYLNSSRLALGLGKQQLIDLLVPVGVLLSYDIISYKHITLSFIDKSRVLRWGIYVFLIDLIVIYSLQITTDNGSFIYFQF
jgi:hypothetical protein